MELWSYFVPIFKAVLIIISIAALAGIMLRKGLLKEVHIESLSHITVILFLPCLTFGKIIGYFNPDDFVYWWILPLLAMGMISVGIGIGSLFFANQIKKKRAFIAIGAFMNANYMVLPIGQLVFADDFDAFATYTFLFVIGVIPFLWSVGKFMVTSDENTKFSAKTLLTPPLIASVLGVVMVLLGISKYIPETIMKPINFIGEAGIPSVTLVLGATLASISLKKLPSILDLVKVLSTKLLILPAITIFVLLQFPEIVKNYPLITDLIVIQASVAPATQLAIMVKKYGGDVQNIGSMMFAAYALCIITIPVWFTIWNVLKNMI